MRKRLLAAGAVLAGAAVVTVPVAAGLGSETESGASSSPGRPITGSWTEPHLLNDAYWMRVGDHVEAVQVTQFLQELERQIQAAAAPRRSGRGSSGGDPASCLASIRDRESHSTYDAVSSGGTYRGAYQFDQRTWDSNAEASGRPDLVGTDPAAADPTAQDQIAADTYARRGNQPWGGRC